MLPIPAQSNRFIDCSGEVCIYHVAIDSPGNCMLTSIGSRWRSMIESRERTGVWTSVNWRSSKKCRSTFSSDARIIKLDTGADMILSILTLVFVNFYFEGFEWQVPDRSQVTRILDADKSPKLGRLYVALLSDVGWSFVVLCFRQNLRDRGD